MDTDSLISKLNAAFANPGLTLADGRILIPSSPLDLADLIEDEEEEFEDEPGLDDGDYENEEDEEDDKDSDLEDRYEFLAGRDSCFTDLVAFYWQSMMPMVWQCYFREMTLDGGGSYAVLFQDDCNPAVLARLAPDAGEETYKALFEALIEDNGSTLGTSVFGSLPSNTHNMAENVIPLETVREAYWNWLFWSESCGNEVWSSMIEEVKAREKDPIGYFRTLLRNIGSRENPRDFLERIAGNGCDLSERAKRAIFEAYFEQSYGPY